MTTNRLRQLQVLAVGLALCWINLSATDPPLKFYPDDPIAREPESQDASKVRGWVVSDEFELFQNSIGSPGEQVSIRARNINTVDEVPDSSWFTNRVGRAGSSSGLIRLLNQDEAPASGPWTIVEGKPEGIQPGFVIMDSKNRRFFVKFDPPSNPEMASGAELVSTTILGTFGYNVPENFIGRIRPEALVIGEHATVKLEGRSQKFTRHDLDKILRRAARSTDGSYRLLASREIPGRAIGPFRYYGTRPDDPNDVFPHEHRRELRGLRVLAAWLNHHDVKTNNTFDTVVDVGGQKRVRHHLLDFGATLGSGSIEAQKRRAGNEFLWEARPTLVTMLTLGFYVRPWLKVEYPEIPAVGRIEGDYFDPEKWKPDFPNPAFENARSDDTFWAARHVAAFSDEVIRASVRTAEFSDRRAEDYLTEILIKRRDKVLRHWLTNVTPLVDLALDAGGVLTFRNIAVDARVADAPTEYVVRWATFDNGKGLTEPPGNEARAPTARFQAPPQILSKSDFVLAEISAAHPTHPLWSSAVKVYFRRDGTGWKTVGIER